MAMIRSPRVETDSEDLSEVSADSRQAEAQARILEATGKVIEQMNQFSSTTFSTRSGRRGAGLGLLLEGLWGFHSDAEIAKYDLEIGWIPDNQYNDYACLRRGADWDLVTKDGELLRIEAKSMDVEADESKGHFDEIQTAIGNYDLLLVIFWRWAPLGRRVAPQVLDIFVGSARRIAALRDSLHVMRGGSFVLSGDCPDCCDPGCVHVGEPLNSSGVRERSSGPLAARGPNASFAANFGGLVRMLKTTGENAKAEFRRCRYRDDVAHEYISFIHRNLPAEERSAYSVDEWRQVYGVHFGKHGRLDKERCQQALRDAGVDYQLTLRELGSSL